MRNSATMAVARERQLDWLLGEVLAGETPAAARAGRTDGDHGPQSRWLAAAVVTLSAGAALGVALLQAHEPGQAQDPTPAIEWYEAHGPESVAAIPAGVVNLRCFDFDDAALAALPRLAQLERLDLSGTAVNEQGYSVSLPITDAGLAHLGALPKLRWLCLATCHQVKGKGLAALEALPLLEHLDLTYTGVESPAVERLNRLGSLRELSLSYCMNFHGRSLAAVARIPGLRRLELRGCTTLSAADVTALSNLRELRHLDLRDCQGRFRGQTASGFSTDEEEPPPPPVQDGIGITDESIAALEKLPLQSLLLGGSESLTDAIGETLAAMTTLRHLDLANLPKTSGALLARIPTGLDSLALDHNPQLDRAALRRLPPLPSLRELGLSGLPALVDDDVRALLAGKTLHVLRLGGMARRSKGDLPAQAGPRLTSATAVAVAAQSELRQLDLTNAHFVDAAFCRALAGLPKLETLDLTATTAGDAATLQPFAACRTLRSVRLVWCTSLDLDGLQALSALSLRDLDLYGTNLRAADIRELAKTRPGCWIKLPKGQRYRTP